LLNVMGNVNNKTISCGIGPANPIHLDT
jgi:hypothetical protein